LLSFCNTFFTKNEGILPLILNITGIDGNRRKEEIKNKSVRTLQWTNIEKA